MYEDKSIDPRDCKFRLLASSKLRKQTERLIKKKKLDFGLIKPKDYDVYNYHFNSNGEVIINRKNRKQQLSKDYDVRDDEIQNDQKKSISMIDEIEKIFLKVDDEQKQTFIYDDIVNLHKFLQHLDQSWDISKEYFHEFLETNFRVVSGPEKRSNLSLDERLRKLKFKAAANEYDSMVANIVGGQRSNVGSSVMNGTAKYSIGQELRNVRSTLLATVNAMMVIVATFFFFYFVIGYARPDLEYGNIVLYSFGASMVVAVAEFYFLIRII